jgi:hypothetical protein
VLRSDRTRLILPDLATVTEVVDRLCAFSLCAACDWTARTATHRLARRPSGARARLLANPQRTYPGELVPPAALRPACTLTLLLVGHVHTACALPATNWLSLLLHHCLATMFSSVGCGPAPPSSCKCDQCLCLYHTYV